MTPRPARVTVLAAAVTAAVTAGGLAAAGPAAATVPACGNHSLAVTSTFSQGGAGHGWLSLVYRNVTGQTCTVYGYPGLDAIDKYGHVLAHATRTLSGYGSGGTVHTVTIAPGGYASAGVEWLNFNPRTSGPCVFSAAVNTIVANTTLVHRLPVSVSACELQVHPTLAGTPGYPDYGPAQTEWIAGSHAAAASQGAYWAKARGYLAAGKAFPTQVTWLTQLIALPDTGLTPAQIKQAQTLTKELDSFFATPGLYF